ncbi:MAG TPA: hypothetical protein VKG43_05675 [Acidimicrobiales bacterium]|nr:hypothetical protein [Acidimicrobiales bacterium]
MAGGARRGPLTLAVAALVATGAVQAAGATGAAAAGPKVPPGYQVVSASFSAPAATQTSGPATCPAGTVVLGGGVTVAGGALTVAIGGSYPATSTQWAGIVDNSSSGAATFDVTAVCADQPPGYGLVSTPATLLRHHSNVKLEVTCPAGTESLGGGGHSLTASLSANLSATLPLGPVGGLYSWTTSLINQGSTPAMVEADVVCGQVSGYTLGVSRSEAAVNRGTQGTSVAPCPGRLVPLGGGVGVFKDVGGVDLAATGPTSSFPHGWRATLNNNGPTDATFEAYATCAN